MSFDGHEIIIGADKTPAGQHARRFNAPTVDEIAIIVTGENLKNRDIVLYRWVLKKKVFFVCHYISILSSRL